MADDSSNNQLPGDICQVDAVALAAEAAKMSKLMDSIESNLASNAEDLRQEEQQWTQAARISVAHVESINLEDNHKHNTFADENAPEQDTTAQAFGESKEEVLDHSGTQNEGENTGEINREQRVIYWEVAPEKEETTNKIDAAKDGDISSSDVDSSSSISSGPLVTVSAAVSLVDDASSMGSDKSLSLDDFRIKGNDQAFSINMSAAEEEQILLKEGVFRVDSSSENQAYICDWNLWRQWQARKSQQQANNSSDGNNNTSNNLESSSQRWGNLSLQDSKLELPARRYSDSSTVGKKSSVCTCASGRDNSDDDDDNDDSASVFDWKAWKRRKDGQRSSTSRTLSVSDDDDDFDATSVLAKLDAWDTMEEVCPGNQNDEGTSSSSSSSEDGDVESTTTEDSDDDDDLSDRSETDNAATNAFDDDADEPDGRVPLNRANSENFKSGRRASMSALRSHSEKGLRSNSAASEETADDWKQWQSTQRRRRMSESWSNKSISLATLQAEKSRRSENSLDSHNEGKEGADTGLIRDISVEDSVKQDTAKLELQNESDDVINDSDKGINNDNALPATSSPDRWGSNNPRPGLQARSNSLRMRSPMQQSPVVKKRRGMMRRSMSLHLKNKSPLQHQSPVKQSMEAWRSWQREKRRSGMLKTASGRDMWNLPITTDSSDANADSSAPKLLKSKSERWGQKDDSSSPTNPRQKLQRAQSEKLHVAPSGEGASFDWNSYREEKRKRAPGRSQSDRWTGDTNSELVGEGGSTNNEAPGPGQAENKELRRAFSEKWDKSGESANELKAAPVQSAADMFDWKSFRKDRQKSNKRSSSVRV